MALSATTTAPAVPGAHPFIGHTLRLMRDPLAFLTSLPQHGDIVPIKLGSRPTVVVCEPELAHQVLIDDRTFDKGGPLFDRLREDILKDGLVSCPHSRHRRYRRQLQPPFHQARLSGYAQTMARQSTALSDGWQDGQIIDVLAESVNLTSRILVETMFSDALPPAILRQAIDDLTTVNRRLYQRAIAPPLLNRIPTPANRRYRAALARLQQTVGRVIDDHRAAGIDRKDLVSALLNNPPAENGTCPRGLTDGEISDHVLNFFIAGSETTSNSLAWAVLLIGQHQEIQQQVQKEADTVLAGAPATVEAVRRLELTNRVFSEALRMYPPAWMLTRTTTTDTELGDMPLRQGTTVIVSPYLIHRRGDIYDDPDRFRPDRWLDASRHDGDSHAFLPFGAGARKCIGDQFGLIEATVVLATLQSRWHFTPVPGEHPQPAVAFTLPPKYTRMRVTARKASQAE